MDWASPPTCYVLKTEAAIRTMISINSYLWSIFSPLFLYLLVLTIVSEKHFMRFASLISYASIKPHSSAQLVKSSIAIAG